MAPSIPRMCQDGRLEEVRAALARGEEVNQRDTGLTGLMLAARFGHKAVVELLLQQPGLDVNISGGRYRQTALHSACIGGHAGIVRRLLAHPSLTCHNTVDRFGRTPLMAAVGSNSVECVRELVAVEGVDLETRDSQGKCLEEVARRYGGCESWQVVRQEKRRREQQVKKEVHERREEESIDDIVDFIEGNDKKMVTKKKKKNKLAKIENIQSGRLNLTEKSFERKYTRKFFTSITNEENTTVDNESVSKGEDFNVDPLIAETICQANCADELLKKNIEDKLQVLKDKKRYANELSKSKSKEMADLLLGIDTAEETKSKGIKEINCIDDQIKEMLRKKDMIAEECQKQNEITGKLLKRKAKLDQDISTHINKSKEEFDIIEKEIEDLKTKLSKNITQIQPEAKHEEYTKQELTRQSNLKLLSYIEQQISYKKSSLECPVCLEVASSPIFMCQEQHLLCGACRPRLEACPECRVNYTKHRRHRYAEMASQELEQLYRERDGLLG